MKGIETFVANLELEWVKKHSVTGEVPIVPATHLKEHLDKYFTKTTKDEREEHNNRTFWGYYYQFLIRMKNGTRCTFQKEPQCHPKLFPNLKTSNATLKITKL